MAFQILYEMPRKTSRAAALDALIQFRQVARPHQLHALRTPCVQLGVVEDADVEVDRRRARPCHAPLGPRARVEERI